MAALFRYSLLEYQIHHLTNLDGQKKARNLTPPGIRAKNSAPSPVLRRSMRAFASDSI